jgi:hypothetical protein
MFLASTVVQMRCASRRIDYCFGIPAFSMTRAHSRLSALCRSSLQCHERAIHKGLGHANAPLHMVSLFSNRKRASGHKFWLCLGKEKGLDQGRAQGPGQETAVS